MEVVRQRDFELRKESFKDECQESIHEDHGEDPLPGFSCHFQWGKLLPNSRASAAVCQDGAGSREVESQL